jgi:hypothetical protein
MTPGAKGECARREQCGALHGVLRRQGQPPATTRMQKLLLTDVGLPFLRTAAATTIRT